MTDEYSFAAKMEAKKRRKKRTVKGSHHIAKGDE